MACASESKGADDVDATNVTVTNGHHLSRLARSSRPNPARSGFDAAGSIQLTGVFRPSGSTGTAVAPLIGD
jgi:hypothetical protein